jgi:hypothetical protein
MISFREKGEGLLVDFVADDAANGCTTHGACGTAARQDCPADGAHSSPNGGVLFLLGHVGTGEQAKREGTGGQNARKGGKGEHGGTFGGAVSKRASAVR